MDELLKNLSINDIEKLKILFPMISNVNEQKQITLRIFFDEYCDLIKKNKSAAYYSSVKCAFKHLICFYGIQKPIQLIGIREAEEFATYLQQKVKKGNQVYFKTLKAAFNKAVEWDYIKENYFRRIKLSKRQKVSPGYINSDQLSDISNKIKNKTIKELVVFAFYTGMRLDEIINLRWKNIDLEQKVITVGDEEFITKGRKQRFIPICEALGNALRVKNEERMKVKSVDNSAMISAGLRTKSENKKIVLLNDLGDPSPDFVRIGIQYVFCKENRTRYCGNYVSREFKKACLAAGIDKAIHFHSLRHSFASNLVKKGVPLYTIKELLGHASITTTEIYAHLNMNSLREAVEKLGKECEGLEARSEKNRKWETEDRRPEAGKTAAKIFRIEKRE